MTIIYEITATVEPHLAEAYERYMLEQHIPDLIRTGCFSSADMARSGNRYQMRYVADSRGKLDDYLNTHADDLRADFAKHFPEGVAVSREIGEALPPHS